MLPYQSHSQHLQKEGKVVLVSPFLEKSSVLLSAWLLLRVLSSLLCRLKPVPMLRHAIAPAVPVLVACICCSVGASGDLHACGVRSYAHPPEDFSFYSGNPNIVPCDQALRKKSSNPYLGRVQGLKFLIALVPGSAACAALNMFWESRSLLLMV